MIIQNQTQSTKIAQTPQPVKTGTTHQATVVEKLPNDEAIVQMKGQDVRVKVEGELPASGRVMLQIKDASQDMPVVKVIPSPVSKEQTTKPTPALPESLRQVVQLLQDNKVPISREMLQQIKTFLDKTPNATAQQLETITRMVQKKLDFTPTQMKAVHEALHGNKLGAVLQDLLTDMDPDFQVQQTKPNESSRVVALLSKLEQVVAEPAKLQAIQQLLNQATKGESVDKIAKAIMNQFSHELKANPELAREVAAIIKEASATKPSAITIQLSGSEATLAKEDSPLQAMLKQAMQQIKSGTDLQKVIQLIKNGLEQVELPSNEKLHIQTALSQAEQLQGLGKELAARQQLAQAVSKVEVPQVPAPEAGQAESTYRLSSDLLASIPIQSRDILVTTITKKLSQAATDFKAVQRDISNSLRTADSLIRQAPIQARPSLESAIKQLDNAILKSDFMLYTDMKTEKQLLQASSQLHEARKLLNRGERGQASEIIHQVRQTVEKIMFQPSDQRVKHFVSDELMKLEEIPLAKQLARSIEEPLQTLRSEPTARNTLEYVRSLGLMRDSDIAHRLVAGDGSKAETDASLKSTLMKLIQAEGNSAAGQRAEQALQNITGQQLLSKSDASGLQTMLFSLPIVLRDQVENVKVFLKSQSNQQKIDWENCSLYFLLETKRMGDVGIMLTAVDRNLSITIKNDSEQFQERITPLAEKAKERLEDIGYHIGKIQFSPLTEVEKIQEAKTEKKPTFTERGYDFTV
nr:hypothetical protein [Paenibacillus bovis]